MIDPDSRVMTRMVDGMQVIRTRRVDSGTSTGHGTTVEEEEEEELCVEDVPESDSSDGGLVGSGEEEESSDDDGGIEGHLLQFPTLRLLAQLLGRRAR